MKQSRNLVLTVTSDFTADTVYLIDPDVNPRLYGGDGIRRVFEDIVLALVRHVEVKIVKDVPGIKDIWVRDFGAMQTDDGQFWTADYGPVYLKDPEDKELIQTAGHFRNALFPKARDLGLVLDGGNLVTNGKVAIVTDTVYRQNKRWRLKHSGLHVLLSQMDIADVFVAPTHPLDPTGHADGSYCFIDEETLLVAQYENEDDAYAAAEAEMLRQLTAAYPVKIVFVPSYEAEDESSAEGCYVNLLSLPDVVVMPVFGNAADENAYEVISGHAHRPVITIEATALAKEGGVVHCVTSAASK